MITRKIRSAVLVSMLAIVAGLMPAAPGPLSPQVAAAAACNSPILDLSGAQIGCADKDIVRDPSGGGDVTPANCVSAQGDTDWGSVRSGTYPYPAKKTRSVLVESAYWSSVADDYYNAMRTMVASAWANTTNTDSFYWGSERGLADLMAAALQIEPTAGSWSNPNLHFADSTSGYRMNLIAGSVRNSIQYGDFMPETIIYPAPPGRRYTIDDLTSWRIRVSNDATAAYVWGDGSSGGPSGPPTSDFPRVPSGSYGYAPLSSAAVENAINAKFKADLRSPYAYDFKRHIWPNDKVSIPPWLASSYKATYVPGAIVKVYTYQAGRWTLLTGTNRMIKAGTPWTAVLMFENRGKSASSEKVIIAAFHKVIAEQVTLQWNDAPRYSDDRTAPQKGVYWVPTLFNVVDSKKPSGCAYSGRGSSRTTTEINSFLLGNIRVSRGTTSNTNTGCPTVKLSSDSEYRNLVTQPQNCWLVWKKWTLSPPAQNGWEVKNRDGMRPALFALPGGTTRASATVGIALRVTAAYAAPAARNFSVRVPSFGDELMDVNLTQMGITAKVGTEVLVAKRYNASDPRGGYAFDLVFDRTPASRLQDQVCLDAYATSTAALESVCGIVFKPVAGRSQAVYRVTIQTWWGGEYHAAAIQSGYYCGIFEASTNLNAPCTYVRPSDAAALGFIAPWPSSGINPTYGPTIAFDNWPKNDNGTRRAGWPIFSGSSPTSPPGTANDGAPVWDSSLGGTLPATSFDIAVTQIQSVP